MDINESLSLFEAVQLWEESPICQSTPRLKSNLATVMRNYILPASFGLPTNRLRSDYLSVMKEISLADFLANSGDILSLFSHPDDYGVKASTFTYYRNVAVKFFDFLYCLVNGGEVSVSLSPIPQFLEKSESMPSQKSPQQEGVAREYQREKLAISLSDEGIGDAFVAQVAEFCDYARNEGLSDGTVDNYLGHILLFLGWLIRYQENCDWVNLKLDWVTYRVYTRDFIEWGLLERGNSLGWASNVIHSCILVARFLTNRGKDYLFDESALKNYLRVIDGQCLEDDSSLERDKPKLSFSMAVRVVDYLRSFCAVNHGNGSRRSEMAIVKSWQRYLLVGLLVFCPIRSSHLCQLSVDGSLLWEKGRFYVDLSVLNTRVAGRMMNLIPIPSFLSEDLCYWCSKLRPLVESKNDYVFMKLGSPRCPESKGEPLSVQDLSDIVGGCISKATLNLFGRGISVKPTGLRGLKNDYLQMLAMMEKTVDYSSILPILSGNQKVTTNVDREVSRIMGLMENSGQGKKKYPLLELIEQFPPKNTYSSQL